MNEEDPVRWSDADPPPELLALVRDASRPPPLPPVLRASVRASVLRAARPLPLRPPFVAGLTVVVIVTIGLVIWRVLPIRPDYRATPLERAPTATRTSDRELERPSAPDEIAHAPLERAEIGEAGGRGVARRLGGTEPAIAPTPARRALPREAPRPSEAATREGRHRETARRPRAETARSGASSVATRPAPPPFVRTPGAGSGPTPCDAFTEGCAEREAPAASAGWGTLTVQTIPWAHVYIDGQDTGRTTPVRGLRVPAGRHEIGLRAPDGTMHRVPVSIVAGERIRIVRQL